MTPAPAIRFDVITLFPAMFEGPLSESILGRAREQGLIDVQLHDLRQWAHDRHRTVDDYPFGGGPGMVMKPEPVFEAIEAVTAQAEAPPFRVYLSPQGRRLDRALVDELAGHERLLLLCGRYEGVDERVLEHAIDMEVSIGDFVVTGGELPAMMLIDAVSRRVGGVLGSEGSLDEESFDQGLLEYPQYTRPAEFRGWGIPEILTSGDHAKVDRWRRVQRVARTAERRPDLLPVAHLTPEERASLEGDPGFAQRRVGDTIFQVRLAAVCTASDGRVLLHRTVGDDIWSFPGGRLRVGESVADGVRREMREEAGMKVEAGDVLWVLENFAEFRSAKDGPGKGEVLLHHEIGVYVEATVPPRFERRESFYGAELAGTADEFALEFRWFAAGDLDRVDVRPASMLPALREHLAAPRR